MNGRQDKLARGGRRTGSVASRVLPGNARLPRRRRRARSRAQYGGPLPFPNHHRTQNWPEHSPKPVSSPYLTRPSEVPCPPAPVGVSVLTCARFTSGADARKFRSREAGARRCCGVDRAQHLVLPKSCAVSFTKRRVLQLLDEVNRLEFRAETTNCNSDNPLPRRSRA